MKYIRFVIDAVYCDTRQPLGVFQAAYNLLRDQTMLNIEHRNSMNTALDWFGVHLNLPQRFARSRKPGANHSAISWLKLDATEHIMNLRHLCDVVSQHHTVFEIRTDRPGYITYEDEYQVLAEPFNDTFRRGHWKQYARPS